MTQSYRVKLGCFGNYNFVFTVFDFFFFFFLRCVTRWLLSKSFAWEHPWFPVHHYSWYQSLRRMVMNTSGINSGLRPQSALPIFALCPELVFPVLGEIYPRSLVRCVASKKLGISRKIFFGAIINVKRANQSAPTALLRFTARSVGCGVRI